MRIRDRAHSRYLEQNFGPHAEEAVNDPESENHWHAVDKPVETYVSRTTLSAIMEILTDSGTMAETRQKAAHRLVGSDHG